MVNSIVNKFGKWIGVEGTFASWFVVLGIFTQLLTGYIMNDTALAVCSGIAGVVSVVLCILTWKTIIVFQSCLH